MTTTLTRVLLVEDNPGDVDLVQEILDSEATQSLRLTCVSLAREAVRCLGKEPFDVVLMDLALPDSFGLDTLRQIQATSPDVPVVVLTGSGNEEVGMAAVRTGAQDYLVKGQFDRRVLVRALRYAIERKQAEALLRKAHDELEQLVQERTAALVDANQQLHALNAHLEKVREDERTRIAREIHDELGQALTGLKMDLAWLKSRIVKVSPRDSTAPLLAKVEEMSNLMDTTIHSVRRIASDLRPGVLDKLGLAAAVEWQAQDFEKRSGIRCVARLEEVDLDRNQSTALFRIFQEALTNIARHAGASEVTIQMKRAEDAVMFDIEDNGRGLDAAARGTTFGVLGMQERAALLGGKLEIVGVAGKGTRVAARIPLRPR